MCRRIDEEDEIYRRLARRDSTRSVRKMRAPRESFAPRDKGVKSDRRQLRRLKEAAA